MLHAHTTVSDFERLIAGSCLLPDEAIFCAGRLPMTRACGSGWRWKISGHGSPSKRFRRPRGSSSSGESEALGYKPLNPRGFPN